MPNIQVLEKNIAELIAAGEVVERPASIAKELIENSIDAGATDISVEITGGGVRMLRVSDNGCGISREDIPKAFLRHATSKVSKAEDLDSILTLGFRGEALASVAAMCRVEITSKTADSDEGTAYTIEGGESMGCAPAGRPTGTTITVRDVFFNTPARMKFLKKDVSEGNAVAQVVDKCALSHPEIAFKFVRDGSVRLKTSGNSELLPVIYAIYGRDFADEMLAVDYTNDGIRVTGYISKPGGAKPSRSYQTFFINSRYVRTRTAAAALEEACKNKVMAGRFPACVLNLALPAEIVDVNVHPAKIEVRFANEKPIFSAVYYAVKTALQSLETPLGATPAPQPKQRNEFMPQMPQRCVNAAEYRDLTAKIDVVRADAVASSANYSFVNRPVSMSASKLDISVDDEPAQVKFADQARSAKIFDAGNVKIFSEDAVNGKNLATTTVETEGEARQNPDYRLIGEVFATYILLEEGDDLLLVDKHAAHERILYERLKRDISYGNRQVLLTPQTVALSREEHAALVENIGDAEKLGFLLEDFGGDAVIVREIPVELFEADVAFILRELADKLKNNRQNLTPHVLDRLYYNIACRSAVKAHDKNSDAELAEIVRQLAENPAITHCPHGRPVLIRLGRRELEKMFGRLG